MAGKWRKRRGVDNVPSGIMGESPRSPAPPSSAGPGVSTRPQLSTTATSAAERIAVIIEAAEKAAASVIDDAEEQASRYLDGARAEADRIVAERLRAVADELDPPASGPRLLATQMAVSGSSREEIEARLRSGFEIEDAAGILDAILGPED
jgi:cell division septum initiation protein DivIVA